MPLTARAHGMRRCKRITTHEAVTVPFAAQPARLAVRCALRLTLADAAACCAWRRDAAISRILPGGGQLSSHTLCPFCSSHITLHCLFSFCLHILTPYLGGLLPQPTFLTCLFNMPTGTVRSESLLLLGSLIASVLPPYLQLPIHSLTAACLCKMLCLHLFLTFPTAYCL